MPVVAEALGFHQTSTARQAANAGGPGVDTHLIELRLLLAAAVAVALVGGLIAAATGSVVPPERAVVLCVDEKSQIQALDRTAPVLPMLPGTPARASHDYVRPGTFGLYAALDLTTGKVIGSLHARHRAIEFKKFLQTLDREVPADLDVHVVLDNASTHKPWRSNGGSPGTPGSSCTSPRPVARG